MPLLNYTTTVAADKTANQIVAILASKKATNIMLEYDGSGNITGIKWRVDTAHGPLGYALPVNVEAVFQVLGRQGVMRFDGERRRKQSVKVAWRILKDWVEAQMALLETGMVTMEEVFLPYMLVGEQRLYNYLEAGGFNQLMAPEPTSDRSDASGPVR